MLKCKFSLVCSMVSSDFVTGGVNLLQIIEEIHAPVVPTINTVPLTYVATFTKSHNEPNNIKATLIATFNKKEIARFDTVMNFQGLNRLRLQAPMPPIAFPSYGVLVLKYIIQRKEYAEYSIDVTPPPSQLATKS